MLRHPRLRARLEQLGVDYCCGGKKRLADAVADAGLDLKTTLTALEQTLRQRQPDTPATDWTAVTLTVLADHILDTHHVFTKTQLARIGMLLARVQNAHRNRHGAMLDALRNAFDPLRAELEAHLMKEEQIPERHHPLPGPFCNSPRPPRQNGQRGRRPQLPGSLPIIPLDRAVSK